MSLHLPFDGLVPNLTVRNLKMAESKDSPKGLMQKILDVVEKVGNMVPHPVLIFVIMIAIVVMVSHNL